MQTQTTKNLRQTARIDLQAENQRFAGTRGVSRRARTVGFVPGFMDSSSGRAVRSRFANGMPAPCHVLDGVPEEWVAKRDASGRAQRLVEGIICGFLRDDRFYTREEAAAA